MKQGLLKVNRVKKLRPDGCCNNNMKDTTIFEPVILTGFTIAQYKIEHSLIK